MSKIFCNPVSLECETYLLDFFLVALLQVLDVRSPFLGFFNFLPGFHFFLLQQGNAVCKQLGVAVDTAEVRGTRVNLLFSSFLDVGEVLDLTLVVLVVAWVLLIARFHL
jgi:hypothetical protein